MKKAGDEVTVKQVQIRDGFWSEMQKRMIDVVIPFQEKVIAVYQRIPGSNLPDSLQRGIFQTPVKLYGNYQTLADSLLCRRFRITNHQWDRTYPGHPFYLVKNQVA